MKYHYDLLKGSKKFKNNGRFRQYIAAGLASMLLMGAAAIPAFAAKPATVPAAAPKATGGIGWVNSGAQAYDDFNAQATSSCTTTTAWDVTGQWEWGFQVNGDQTATVYTHEGTLTQTGSTVTGSGGYPTTGPPYSFGWNGNGSVIGNTFNLTWIYTIGAVGTTQQMTGTIEQNGTMHGTWSDNYGGTRTGTWASSLGAASASPVGVGCTGKGSFTYSDSNGINYVMDVQYVNVSGNQTWFAGPTTSGNFGIGRWIFIKVADNGEPGIGHDQIWGEAVASEAVAKNSVANKADPAGGPFTITSGNLQVH